MSSEHVLPRQMQRLVKIYLCIEHSKIFFFSKSELVKISFLAKPETFLLALQLRIIRVAILT